MPAEPHVPRVSNQTARRLVLHASGLDGDPMRRATSTAVLRAIGGLCFVQVDSINIVERAHHHILMSRLDGYRPPMLTKLLENDRSLFEHWTHDAAVIPIASYPHWRHRFRTLSPVAPAPGTRWAARLGDDPRPLLRHVLARIRREGPLASADFEHQRDRGRGNWWDWKPQKSALEYLWRAGKLAISGRSHFNKRYDLCERVIPEAARSQKPSRRESIDWACRRGMDCLAFATPRDLARFTDMITIDEAKTWCARAEKRGDVEAVDVERVSDGETSRRYAWTGWQESARRCSDPPDRMRLLSPFDPLLRDRPRTREFFGFDYRFEAFVPAPKRHYGYYVLPILHRDRLVARVDAKLHRDESRLVLRGPWWESGVRKDKRALRDAVGRYTAQIGAEDWSLRPAD